MAKLIDKDALVAEIERLYDEKGAFYAADVLNNLEDWLDVYEVKEVDLESEMDKYFETMGVLEHEKIFEDTFQRIAKHFFELGVKARQG